MMVAQAHRTTASAKGFVEDTGFQERHPLRRRRLIDLSRKWQASHVSASARIAAIDRQLEIARRKYQVAPVARSATPARAMIEMVAAWHGLTGADILSNSRKRVIVTARRDAIVAVMHNCRIMGRPLSYPEVGRVFGRDHTTILFAIGKIKRGSHV